MKIFKLICATSMVMNLVEGRFVKQSTRDHSRIIRQEMERNFGPGLKHLHDPVTGEFNHMRVIEMRGGRRPQEFLGTEKSLGIHQALGFLHGIVGGEDNLKEIKVEKKQRNHPEVTQDWGPDSKDGPTESKNSQAGGKAPSKGRWTYATEEELTQFQQVPFWLMLGDHDIDQYSMISFMYGWTKGLMKDPESPDSVVSACYNSLFYSVQSWDAFMLDVSVLDQSLGFFDMIIYHPQRLFRNAQTVYDTCGSYSYLVKLQLIFEFDIGYLSELITRLSIIIADQAQAFFLDMYQLFAQCDTDWYLVGYRVGMLWKIIFDVELDPIG